jgi:peptide/nickel transport system ATP-binding protein
VSEPLSNGNRVEVKGLTLRAGDKTLLQDMNLEIPASCITALVGPSGAGKSLTARACLGLLRMRPGVTAGTVQVHLDGQIFELYGDLPRGVRRQALKQIRGGSIGLLPQDPLAALDPMLTVYRQIKSVLALSNRPRGRTDVLEALGLGGFDDPEYVAMRYPHELSGGMAQRVCIAQALARQSRFLIADEPVTGLDPGIAQGILSRLKELPTSGVGLLIITHDLRVVRDLADRVLVIHRGRVVEELRPNQLNGGRHPVTQSLVQATAKVAGGWS